MLPQLNNLTIILFALLLIFTFIAGYLTQTTNHDITLIKKCQMACQEYINQNCYTPSPNKNIINWSLIK